MSEKNGRYYGRYDPNLEVHYDKDFYFHRKNGPAVLNRKTGETKWYIHGKRYHRSYSYQRACGLSKREMFSLVLLYGDLS